ncbi:MAG: response regulator [Deltaproteobacteria bacterium]|jgi:response regulator RpfG family c-di-GMP phosphodiesterase|nr:response regulator [Deltaproteobacteria bacterium]
MADSPPLIMLVDDNRTNLMAGKVSLSDDYTVLTVSSARKMLDLLDKQKPELILLDVVMPEMSGFEAIQILRSSPETRDIPVIFLTALSDADKELEGISLGASDYIMKPFSPPLLRQRIAIHIELGRLRRRNRELEARASRAVQAAREPDAGDRAAGGSGSPPGPYEAENLAGSPGAGGPGPAAAGADSGSWESGGAGHEADSVAGAGTRDNSLTALLRTQRAVISALASRAAWVPPDVEAAAAVSAAAGSGSVFVLFEAAHLSRNWPSETDRWDLRLLGPAALLHDIGKLYVPEEIIMKPGRLTPAELEQARRHVELGTAFIRRISDAKGAGDYLRYARILAGYHHERWDGRGYPCGLRGEDIPLLGRLMAVADVYEALICVRPYRIAMDHAAARAILREGAGTAFDPDVVAVFEKALG